MSAKVVPMTTRSPPAPVPVRPLIVRAADALGILAMAREQLKTAKVDHRRGDVRHVDTLLLVVEDTLRRGIKDQRAAVVFLGDMMMKAANEES